jgi:mRNA-degrading endonuclease RelE of RelBE toxin-antitoxin system
MKIALAERFQSDVRRLREDARGALFDLVLALPDSLGRPHVHAGLGMRKIHPSGIYEARAGLGLRVLFTLADGVLTLVRVGTHDDVRKFLKSL